MIRNCIIYRVDESAQPVEHGPAKTRGVSLKSIIGVAKEPERKRLQSLMSLCRGERLTTHAGSGQFDVFSFHCDTQVRRLTASGDVEMPFVPIEFNIWLGRKIPWAVTFDAGRRISRVATILVGFAALGHSFAIQPIKLNKETFRGLKDWAISSLSSKTGAISRVTVENVLSGKVSFKQVVLRANGLEGSSLFDEFFDRASAISNMTFFTPKSKSTSRSICCKLSYWGGLTIYTPQPLDSEVAELVRELDIRYNPD